MKKNRFLLVGLGLAFTFFFYSCEDNADGQVSSNVEPQLTDESSDIYRWPCIIDHICIPIFEPGRRLWFSSLCVPGIPYQCSFYTGREQCFPIVIDCFWWRDPWDWVDPWQWREYIEPLDIYDFRVDLEDVINPKEDFGTFPINEHLMGLQYYHDLPGLIDKETYYVHSNIELDDETVESIGLKGNVIPAGKYPVAYNEKNGTFNAIVSVDRYPITKKKTIAVGNFEKGNLTEFLENPEFEMVETAEVTLNENGIGLVGYTPNPDDPDYPDWPFPWPGPWPWPWITIFTPNDLSLGIQLYEPEPTPWEIQRGLKLNEKVAEILSIEPFELTNENMEYSFDKELGVTTILIHRPM